MFLTAKDTLEPASVVSGAPFDASSPPGGTAWRRPAAGQVAQLRVYGSSFADGATLEALNCLHFATT